MRPDATADTDFRVGVVPLQVIGWAGVPFFSFCAVMSWLAGQPGALAVFLLFVGLSAHVLLSASRVEIGAAAIRVIAPLASYEILWNDVQRVECGRHGTLVFHGTEDRRLVLISPMVWSGKSKFPAIQFLVSEVSRRRLNLTKSLWADYKTQRNVRLRSSELP